MEMRRLCFVTVMAFFGVLGAHPAWAKSSTACQDKTAIQIWLDRASAEGVSPSVMRTPDDSQAEEIFPIADHGGADQGCLSCHSNAGFLMSSVTPPEAPPEDG